MLINPIDREALHQKVLASKPVPNFCIDNFLDESFANEVYAAYPSYDEAARQGKSFNAVNEKGKVQITDSKKFTPAVARLNDALAAPEFRDLLSYVFDIPDLLADEQLLGGGIHQTGPRGHLDVHLDFNYVEDRKLHRRLNILIYFNKNWQPEWGGEIELWDENVQNCIHSFSPIFNRCVVFATNEISYHGVTAVKCPPDMARRSFAAYYYTTAAPAGWDGTSHSTIFKARPDEKLKGSVFMPAEKASRWMDSALRKAKDKIKGR